MYWSKIKSISVLFNHFDIMSHCILSFILNKKPLGSLKWSNNAAFSEAQQKQIHLLSREKCAQNCAHRTTTAKIKRCTHKDYCIYEKHYEYQQKQGTTTYTQGMFQEIIAAVANVSIPILTNTFL